MSDRVIIVILFYVFLFFFFFFNDTATTEIYTLSLHDALPISAARRSASHSAIELRTSRTRCNFHDLSHFAFCEDRKSTRLNSSHDQISYAVFCLKKKKTSQASASVGPYSTLHLWVF